jgi:putative flippase GtrA
MTATPAIYSEREAASGEISCYACGMKRILLDPVESIVLQAPRAFVASIATSSLDVGLMTALVEFGNWPPLVAATVSYLTGGVGQYIISSKWVFPNGPRSAALGFTAFTLLSLVGLALTWVIMACLCDWAHVNYAAAKLAALGASFTWNFLSRKYLVFTQPAQELELVELSA